MRAAEVLNRYANGERNFQNVSLKRQKFRNQDLSGADFSGADIRGANFRGATLARTKFIGVKAGLTKRWIVILLLLMLGLVTISASFLSALSYGSASYIFSASDPEDFWIGLDFIFGIGRGWYLFLSRGTVAVAIAIAIAIAVASTFAGAVAVAVAFTNSTNVIAIGLLLTIIQFLLAMVIARRTLREDSRYLWLYTTSLALSSLGGTSFREADLSYAEFKSARLKNTDLRARNLHHTLWNGADPKLNLARTENTYLADRRIRTVLRTGEVQDKSFDRLDLRGINLSHANLSGCSFRAADLSDANLQFANLTDTLLIQTQLDAADLTGANLTGACIEDWGLTINTCLKDVRCHYIFMKDQPPGSSKNRRRKPDNGNQDFEDGDFADFIKPLTDTLDLYHNRDVDPRAIAISFKQLSDDNPDANLQIVSMESRGIDKFMLRAKTAENADKSALNSQYTQNYEQVRNLPSEQQLQLLLKEKDNRIQSLEKFLEQAINRPNFLTIEQKQGDYMPAPDQSIQVGGDMIGNTIGDNNTVDIQIQPTNVPQPQTVNIAQEIDALKHILTQLQSEDQRKIDNAIADAQDELKKQKPNKDEVGQALGRALDYAQKTQGFAESIDKLRPHVANAAGWLGKNWYKLLAIVGLAA